MIIFLPTYKYKKFSSNRKIIKQFFHPIKNNTQISISIKSTIVKKKL